MDQDQDRRRGMFQSVTAYFDLEICVADTDLCGEIGLKPLHFFGLRF